MTKLLIVAPQLPYPATDGGKISIYYPLIHLTQFFEVHFAFIHSQPLSQNIISHFQSLNIKIYPQYLNTKDSPITILFNVFGKLPYKFKKYCRSSILKSLSKIVKDENIKFIWCNHAHVAWYAQQLKKESGAKIFLREHNIEYSLVQQVMQVTTNKLLKFFIKQQYLKTRQYEIECWQTFDKTFFISDFDYSRAKESYVNHEKLKVLFDSFYESKALPDNNREPYSFIFTGNIESYQNFYNLNHFLKNIWIPLIEKDSKWKLYITGNNNEVIQRKLTIDCHKYNIVNLGFVDDIDKVINSKKYFVSPTYIGSGIRIKVLNAMSCGAVCFLTPLDAEMLNFFKDLENIVKFYNFKDFMDKLSRLESNKLIYNYISLHSLQVREMFNWKEYAVKVYNEITRI